MPMYVTDILEQLGWNDGTYLPISNEENKALEALLEARTKEVESLRAETEIQKTKEQELDHHWKNLQSEHQENMNLLVVYKEQLDNEEHLIHLANREVSINKQEIEAIKKQSQEIQERSERNQVEIAKVLRLIESLRTSVSEEQGALEEWKSALQRSQADIDAINKFSKEDAARIAELEGKRQKIKIEHDKQHEILTLLCGELHAEEKACERISDQIAEALTQRRQTVSTWAGAVENLRQRDKDIKAMKEELDMAREFAKKRADCAREKQDFLNSQKNNNAEAEGELEEIRSELSQKRQHLQNLKETTKMINNEFLCTRRELSKTNHDLSDCRAENKGILREIQTKEEAVKNLHKQIEKYNENLKDLMMSSKSAAQRIKQLENIIRNEEKYIKQLTVEQNRIQTCSFYCQKNLTSLQDEEGNLKNLIEVFRSTEIQLESRESELEREIRFHDENFYKLNKQLESVKFRISKMEGTAIDVDYEVELEMKRNVDKLKNNVKELTANISLMTSQIARLESEANLFTKKTAVKQAELDILTERLQDLTTRVEGGTRQLKKLKQAGRNRRADESTLRLKIAYAERSLKKLGEQEYTVEKAQLDLEAAINERLVEINERQAVLLAHKRTLEKEKGVLLAEIRLEEIKIDQFKKRYDIFVSFLGKDEMGEALSVTYFKIKNAQERAELQEEGDKLDAEIKKGEQEIAALEATLLVVDTINTKYIKSLEMVKDDDPEMIEYKKWCEEYEKVRDLRSKVATECRKMSEVVEKIRTEIDELETIIEKHQSTRDEISDELAVLQKELMDQQDKITRANNLRKKSAIKAKKKINDSQIWNLCEMEVQTKLLAEANKSLARQLQAQGLLDLKEKAIELGINLLQIESSMDLASRSKGSRSNRSSAPSDQESTTQRTSGSRASVSVRSVIIGEEQKTSKPSYMKERLQAARAPRTPVSDSSREDKSSGDLKLSQRTTAGPSTSHPINVVMLGLDTYPVKQGVSASAPSKLSENVKSIRTSKTSSSVSKPSKK